MNPKFSHLGDYTESMDSLKAQKCAIQRCIDETHERRSKYWTDLFKTITSPIAWLLEPPAADTPELRIGQETEKGLPLNKPRTDISATVTSKTLNTLDRSGLTHRRGKGPI